MKKIVLVLAVLLVSVSACKNPFLKKMLVEEGKGKTIPAAPEKPQLPNPQEPAVPENPANPEVPEPEAPKYTITFGVGSGLGALKAEVDGNEITTGDSVEQGKSVVFTAEPAEGYVLEQWTNAGLAITEAGTDKTYTHTVTANADIKVKFDAPFIEGGASLILSPDKLDITVKVTTADSTPITVEGCTETTLTSGAETVLHAKGTRVILKGNIIELYCGSYNDHDVWNKLAALNVQGLSSLQELYCGYNLLSTLNIQGLSALQELSCYGNLLTELNVQGLTALKRLICWNNQLTALNVQGLTALKRLHCSGNQLTALDVQGCTALQTLDCFANQLTALNVQGLTTLEGLVCYGNQLTELNVQGLISLQGLVCYGNQLTALNVQGLTALKSLSCDWNRLTALNVQGCTALKELYCYNNQLTALNMQGLTALQGLHCDCNQLTSLNAQGLTALRWLSCNGNRLTSLNVHGLTALKRLYCWSNRLNADAFKKLFDDLPQRANSDDARCILYTEESGVSEGNHTDFTDPQDVKDAFNNAKNNKKWKMYKWNGNWPGVEI